MKRSFWFLSTDPEYLRIRNLILRFFTVATGRVYVDGRLTPDQEDDVQDAFLGYFEKIWGFEDPKFSQEVRLFFEVLDIRFLKEQASKLVIGGETVDRVHIYVNSEGYTPARTDTSIETDPDDDEPRGHYLPDEGAERVPISRAELSVIASGMIRVLSRRELNVIRRRYLDEESFGAISRRLRIPEATVRSHERRGMKKIRDLCNFPG